MNVCNRGHTSSKDLSQDGDKDGTDLSVEDGHTKCTATDGDDDLSFLLEEPDTSIDPYSIDIYSYYGNNWLLNDIIRIVTSHFDMCLVN